VIHPTAVVDKGAGLGVNVTVGPFSYVESGAQIGDNCVLGPHVTVYGCTSLGEGCEVHAGAVLGDTPQDTAFQGGDSRVVIGRRCRLREGITIHRGTKPGSLTEIGDDCFLMGFTHFAHNVKIGNRVIVVNGSLLAGYVEVGDGAFISGNCAVHQFVKIGRLAMLGGVCSISKDVPPFCMVMTGAVNEVGGLNVVGMRRAGLGAEDRLQVKRAFNVLYRSGYNVTQALDVLRRDFPSGVAAEFAAFAAASKRGFCALAARRGAGDKGCCGSEGPLD
jgi:UDP-N-acetylglucosamine acyltransferase